MPADVGRDRDPQLFSASGSGSAIPDPREDICLTDLPLAKAPGAVRVNGPLIGMSISVVVMGTGLVVIQASDLTGVQFSFWRLWCTVVALGVLVGVRAIWFGIRPPPASFKWAIWPGLFSGIAQPLMFTAMKWTSVTDVVLLTSLMPLLVSLVAVRILGERPGGRFLAWSLLAVVGAGIVAFGGSTGIEGNPLGMAMAGVSLIGWAFYMVSLKIARMHLDAFTLLWSIFGIAGVVVTIYVAVTGWDFGTVSNRDWILLAYMTALPGGVGLLLMTWSYRWLPASIPPLVLRAEPVVASGLAWWLLSEPITMVHLVGGGLALTGVICAILSPSGQRLMADERTKAHLTEGI